mgnify:CR=1 FL=1
MSYDLNRIADPRLREVLELIMDITSGHDHDGVNAKLITAGSAPDDLAVTNAKLANDVKVGSLAALTTAAKTDVVAAINEVDAAAGANTTSIGTLADLDTSIKTNLVAALNEAYAAIAGAAEAAADAIADANTAAAAVAAKASLTGAETLTNKTLTTPVVASVYQDAGKTKLMTIPDTTSDTLAAIAATQTLTNKTLTTPIVPSLYQDAGKTKLMTVPNTASDTLVAEAATQTLTNKSLTTPTITDGDTGVKITSADQTHAAPTVTIPNIVDAADTFVMVDTAQTLTNKSLSAPFVGSPEITFASTPHDYEAGAADWTLSAAELKASILKPTNANAPVNAIVADATNKIYVVINGTGQSLTVKTAAGTGVTIANAKTAMVMSDGVNVIRITLDA